MSTVVIISGSLSSGMDEFRSRQREKWRRVAPTWYAAQPPAVPSAEDIRNFEMALGGAVEHFGFLAILGCTPSLRRLAVEVARQVEGHVVVIDFLPEMYNASCRVYGLSSRYEGFLCGDWTEPPVKDESVSAALGDKALDNIDPSKWSIFFDEMARILVSAGKLIVHVGLTDESANISSVDDALHNWEVRVQLGQCSVEQASAGLWEDLLSASAGRGQVGTLSIKYWEPDISKLLHSPMSPSATRIVERFYEEFATTFSDVWSDCRLEKILEASNRHFELGASYYSRDYIKSDLQPVLCLNRKS
jgi:Methyltransferase domain